MATPDALLAKVYERPDDDALRAVWADALTERGDPRGEFVTLQLATARGESTPAQQRRAHALFLKHWKKWVGPLAPSLMRNDLGFERGLLAVCTYRFVSRPKLMKVVDDPVWSTVRELRLRDGATPAVFDLLTSPRMRSLRSVLGLDGEQLATLMTSGWKVDPAQRTPLAWTDVSFRLEGPPSTEVREVIGSGVGLPHLKALGLAAPPRGRAFTSPGELRWLFDSPLLERVERLTLSGVGPLGELITALGTKRRRAVALHKNWESHFGRLPSGRCERLSLGAGRCDLVITRGNADDVEQALATVAPDALTSLRVTLPGEQHVEVVKRAARRFSRLEVCEVDLERETR